LGRGDVDLDEKGSLKTKEGKTKEKSFENGRINEAERAIWVRQLVTTNWLIFPTGYNFDELVVLFAKKETLFWVLTLPMRKWAPRMRVLKPVYM